MNSAIRRSLLEIKRAIDSPRRTELVSCGEEKTVSLDAFRTVEDAVVYVDDVGNLHRVSEKIFDNLQKGEGRIPPERAVSLRTDRALLLFGNRGGVYALDCEDVPECRSAKDKGVIPERLVQKFTDDFVLFLAPFDPEKADARLLFVTEHGMGKCSAFEEYRINRKKFESMLLREGDRIVYASIRHGESPIEFTLSDGKRKIRRDPVSVTGRRTYGVRAVKLEDGKTVVSSVQSK
jgi:DNA gyrase/topoisomerase IV subunit A